MRGVFYAPTDYCQKNRYRFDTLNYYLIDIQWFSFSFVLGLISIIFIIKSIISMESSSRYEVDLNDDDKEHLMHMNKKHIGIILLIPTACIRIFMMLKMSSITDS